MQPIFFLLLNQHPTLSVSIPLSDRIPESHDITLLSFSFSGQLDSYHILAYHI